MSPKLVISSVIIGTLTACTVLWALTYDATPPPCGEPAGAAAADDRRFVARPDCTVLDRESELVWAQRDSGLIRNQARAARWCQSLALPGSGWRLPSAEELRSLRQPREAAWARCGYARCALPPVFQSRAVAFWPQERSAGGMELVLHVGSGFRLKGVGEPPNSTNVAALCVRPAATADLGAVAWLDWRRMAVAPLAAVAQFVLAPAHAAEPDPLAEIERLEALQRELLERIDARRAGDEETPEPVPAPAAILPSGEADASGLPALRGRLVYASMRRLYLLELPDLTPRELDIGGARAFDPSFSPDGRRIAFGNVDLHIHELESGRTRHLIDGALHARFHPTRPWLVYGTSGRGLFVHDIEQDRIAQLIGPELSPFQPAWSPNARDVVFVGTPPGEANHYLFFVSTNCLGEPACVPQVRRLVTSGRMNHEPTWSPNARWIAFTRIEHNEDTWGVYVLEFETGRYRRISPPGMHDISPMWLPDSQHLIVVRHDDPLRSGMRNLYLIDREGRTLKRLTRDGAGLASFHPETAAR